MPDFQSTYTGEEIEAVIQAFKSLQNAGFGWVPNGDKGDITLTGGVWTIDNGVVGLAKMAPLANGSLIGKASAGTGTPEALTPAQVRTLLNIANGATANSPDAALIARGNHTGTQSSATINDFAEAVDDRLAAILRAGPNVTLTYDDAAGTFTIAVSDAATGGGGGTPVTPPPTTNGPNPNAAAISDAYKAEPDSHSHAPGGSLALEHERVLAILKKAECDKVAVQTGNWFDVNTWHPSGVPTVGQKVGIPVGTAVIYDQVSATVMKGIRVDGVLQFGKTAPSRLFVDTIIVAGPGKIEIGTAVEPCTALVEIMFSTGNIDTTVFDPFLFSRGLVSHGEVSIYGRQKTPYVKMANAAQGATTLTVVDAVSNWAVGDSLVITGTRLKNWTYGSPDTYEASEDERVTITAISGSTITFTPALVYPHQAPAPYAPYVANLTRNIRFSSPAGTPVHQRGHTMFMHTNKVKCYYAAFINLGRTNKALAAADIGTFGTVTPTTNTKGRYAVHAHKAGTADQAIPVIVEGCVADTSAGWGYAHHSSHAEFNKCVAFDHFGAGYAAEDGDETGIWQDSIAIRGQGIGAGDFRVKDSADVARHDNGRTGDGFFFAGRVVKMKRCVAANCTNGFVWMHRSGPADPFTDNLEHPEISYGKPTLNNDRPSVHGFDSNEAFACFTAMIVVKADFKQHHDTRTLLPNLKAWEVVEGASLSYTGHYTMANWDLLGAARATDGIHIGSNGFDMVFINCICRNFDRGCSTSESWANAPELEGFPGEWERIFIDQQFVNCGVNYSGFVTTAGVRMMSSAELTPGRLSFTLSSPTLVPFNTTFEIAGIKSDSISVRQREIGGDDVQLAPDFEIGHFANRIGYYLNGSGQPVLRIPDLVADRVTGALLRLDHDITINCTEAQFKSQFHVNLYGGGTYLGVYGAAVPTPPSVPAGLWVSQTGSNSNPGTFDAPFATIQYAWSQATPGTTIWVKDDLTPTAFSSVSEGAILSVNGTAGNPITLRGYPIGTRRVISFANTILDTWGGTGIRVAANYAILQDLAIRNVAATGRTNPYVDGVNWRGTNGQLINCEIGTIGGRGLTISENGLATNLLVQKCDIHDCFDPASTVPYNNADGIQAYGATTGVIIEQCRIWRCADDGIDLFFATAAMTIRDNWISRIGYRENGSTTGGDGNGVKAGSTANGAAHLIERNLFWDCRTWAIANNDSAVVSTWRRNTAIDCLRGYEVFRDSVAVILQSNAQRNGETTNMSGSTVVRQNNSFDTPPGITQSDSWFVSVSRTGVDAARDVNGNLPTITFGQPANGSPLVGAGFGGETIGVGTAAPAPSGLDMTPAFLTSGGSPDNTATITTSSISWLAGDVIEVFADINYAGSNGIWTCTATGLTFTLRYSTQSNGNRPHLWTAIAASGGSGTITLAGDTADAHAYAVTRYRPDAGTTLGLGTLVAGSVVAGTANSVGGLTAGANDYLVAYTGLAGDSGNYGTLTATPRAGWTELGEARGADSGWGSFVHCQISPQGGEATASVTLSVGDTTSRMIVMPLTLS